MVYKYSEYLHPCITWLPYVLDTGEDTTFPNCIIFPLNPSFPPTDGAVNNGTSNVMINCLCYNIDNQQIRWYSPVKEQISLNSAEPKDLPYVILEKGTLVIPLFNDSYEGTYYCGIENNSILTANINLTLWTGMCVSVSELQYILW